MGTSTANDDSFGTAAIADPSPKDPAAGPTPAPLDQPVRDEDTVEFFLERRRDPKTVDRHPIELDRAGPEDDAELRRLLRENPIPGRVTLATEREPSFFLGAPVEGDVHQTVVAREPGTGWLVGFFTRCERPAFVSGHVSRIAGLGQLRVARGYRGRRGLLARGFEEARQLCQASDAPLTISAIHADNANARRFLERDLPGFPLYRRLGDLHLHVLPVWGHHRVSSRFEIRRARRSDLEDIVECLQRNLRRRHLAPVWTADLLLDPERTRGLEIEDFLIAVDGRRVVAVVALWDQGWFKQVVVDSYAPEIERWRRPLDVISNLFGTPRLPRPGDPFPHAFLSHLAVEDDDPELARAIVAAAFGAARDNGYSYLALSLGGTDPLRAPLAASFRHLTYRWVVYSMHWEGEPDPRRLLDDRPLLLDAATL